MQVYGEWCVVKHELGCLLNGMFGLPGDQRYEFDSLLSIRDLTDLGYPRNFPHLTCMLCSIDPQLHQEFSDGARVIDSIMDRGRVQLGLLPATCYRVYLDRRDTDIKQESVIACEARCFRFEDKPLDAYRGYNFTMKEFVYLGSSEGATKHALDGKTKISRLLDSMGIAHEIEVASDPFFDSTSSVAAFSRVAPTKTEIVFDGHAISSLNIHRTYFGKKLNITIGDAPINTSCVAFGIERWLSMLMTVFSTPDRTRQALDDAMSSYVDPEVTAL